MSDGMQGGVGLAEVVDALTHAGPDLDAVSVAESLWLAAVSPPRPPAHSGGVGQGPVTGPAGVAGGAEDPGGEPLSRRGLPDSGAGGGSATHVVALPGTTLLPGVRELARALQPFKRAWPRGRTWQLDIDATVAAYGRTAELVPVLQPAPERWFELVLVIDRSASMVIWRDVIDEFTRALRNLGAFRTLTVREFQADLPEPVLRRQGGTAGEELPFPRLGPPGSRRLTVVVSDCTADAWRDGRMWEQLHRWARTAPTALVNPLPVRIWRHTGVDLPAVRAGAAPAPGAGNDELSFPEPLLDEPTDCLPVPALSLSARSLGQWARVLMRGSPEGCDALLVAPHEDMVEPVAEPHTACASEGFRYLASDPAVRLAVLCSPFPAFTLDLVRLVADTLVPEATTADIAELVAAGPLTVSSSAGTVWLKFRTDALTELRAMLSTRDAWRLYDVLVHRESTVGQAARPHALVGERSTDSRALADPAAYVLKALRVTGTVLLPEEETEPEQPAAPQPPEAQPQPGHFTGDTEAEDLRSLVIRARFVLFDFDGPICRLFGGRRSETIAQELVRWLESRGLQGLLTAEEHSTVDPYVVLRAVERRHPGSDLVVELEERLTSEELRAVSTAWPTAYADPLIRIWHARGALLAVTTNISPRAVREYVRSRGLEHAFASHIYGRTQQLDLLKPAPYVISRALHAMGAVPADALQIGDSPVDFVASQAAAVPFLGVARNERRAELLRAAGAQVVVSSLQPVLEVLQQTRA